MRLTGTFALLCLFAAACSRAQTFNVTQTYNTIRFNQLVGLFHPDDGGNRLYALEQSGIISSFPTTGTMDTVRMLDIRRKITAGGETGLLGFAFDPDFRNNGIFYLDFTRTTRIDNRNQLQTMIARYHTLDGNPLIADTASEEIILTINQPYQNHNGGCIAFGPDGYLYIGMGDGGSGGDPQGNGQNRTALLGKILRIDVRGKQGNLAYRIPADNPFVGNAEGFRPEIYAYGLRNPWRFSFDPANGRLWAGDVGQDKWEEVDIIEKGKNYGWNTMEATHCYPPGSNCDTAGLVLPIWEYPHDTSGGVSITGGMVYRGTAAPALVGKYIYADYGNGKIWAITYDSVTGRGTNQLVRKIGSPISSFALDVGGELLVCGYDGRIYRFSQTSGVEPEAPGDAASAIGSVAPNPTASAATITYTIHREGRARMTLHDAMGREVATLLDERASAGEHQLRVDCTTLPAATYFCRMIADGVVSMERLVVEH